MKQLSLLFVWAFEVRFCIIFIGIFQLPSGSAFPAVQGQPCNCEGTWQAIRRMLWTSSQANASLGVACRASRRLMEPENGSCAQGHANSYTACYRWYLEVGTFGAATHALTLAVGYAVEAASCQSGTSSHFAAAGMLPSPEKSMFVPNRSWPYGSEEILEHFWQLQSGVQGCQWSSDPVDCLATYVGTLRRPWNHGFSLLDPYVAHRISSEVAIKAVYQWVSEGLENEFGFWMWWLEEKRNGDWLKDDVAEDWTYDDLCGFTEGASPAFILNAGSGPIAPRGVQCGNKAAALISTDGLAHTYWRLYEKLSLHPPALPVQCLLERLSSCFPPSHFHVVHARNALDHSLKPIQVIREMLRVTRPGGVVLLRHGQNEAKFMKFQGMHLWSFDVNFNFRPPHAMLTFMFRAKQVVLDINAIFANEAVVSARLVSAASLHRKLNHSSGTYRRLRYVFVELKKRR